MNEILNILEKRLSTVNVNYLPKEKLMPDRGTLSVDKAKKLIDYDPQYPIEKGFEKYIKWYKDIFINDIELKEKLDY